MWPCEGEAWSHLGKVEGAGEGKVATSGGKNTLNQAAPGITGPIGIRKQDLLRRAGKL